MRWLILRPEMEWPLPEGLMLFAFRLSLHPETAVEREGEKSTPLGAVFGALSTTTQPRVWPL